MELSSLPCALLSFSLPSLKTIKENLPTKTDIRRIRDMMSPDFVAGAVLKLLEDRINGSVLIVSKEKGYECVGLQENVSVADLQKEKGEEFVKNQQQIHGSEKIAFVRCDVTKEEEYRNAFEFTRDKFSKIDVVINNAGIVDEQNPRKTVEVNLIGPIIGCQLAIEYLGKSRGGKGGIVLNTASIVGLLPFHGIPVYSATKHGVVGLTRSYGMPYHLEREGIIFTALCPFFVETAIIDSVRSKSLLSGFDPVESYDIMT